MPECSDNVEINASPDTVFAAVSQLDQMGKFSPENTGGTWVKGSTGPALGARFKGTNKNEKNKWTTSVKVVAFDPPTTFAFDVSVGPFKVSRWSYAIEPSATGSRVTETWVDRRSNFAKNRSKGIVADRETFTRGSIRTTLDALKASLEG